MSVVVTYTHTDDEANQEDLQFAAALIAKIRREYEDDERANQIITLIELDRHLEQLARENGGSVPIDKLHALMDALIEFKRSGGKAQTFGLAA